MPGRFRLWAPGARKVDLSLDDGKVLRSSADDPAG